MTKISLNIGGSGASGQAAKKEVTETADFTVPAKAAGKVFVYDSSTAGEATIQTGTCTTPGQSIFFRQEGDAGIKPVAAVGVKLRSLGILATTAIGDIIELYYAGVVDGDETFDIKEY